VYPRIVTAPSSAASGPRWRTSPVAATRASAARLARRSRGRIAAMTAAAASTGTASTAAPRRPSARATGPAKAGPSATPTLPPTEKSAIPSARDAPETARAIRAASGW
jgi:hypothetical protein